MQRRRARIAAPRPPNSTSQPSKSTTASASRASTNSSSSSVSSARPASASRGPSMTSSFLPSRRASAVANMVLPVPGAPVNSTTTARPDGNSAS